MASTLNFGLALLLLFAAARSAAADWIAEKGYRWAPLLPSAPHAPGFKLLSGAAAGILFTNLLSDTKAAENQIRLNGSGVAFGDVDGDGWCDLYLCGLENGNRLYRNLGGWRFDDVTTPGLACEGQYSAGATFADVDGDADLDLLVTGLGVGTRLFSNDGQGRFVEVTGSGLVRRYAGTTLALADVDGDADLDLYVANYRTTTIRSTGLPMLQLASGQLALRPQDREEYEMTPQGLVLEHGEPHFLYLNDGRGSFQPVSWTNGVFLDEEGRPLPKQLRDWGLMVACRDLNGDRAPELYICGDFHSPDRLWLNDGRGGFRAIAREAIRCTATFSMAVDFADINRDGLDDFLNMDMLDLEHARRIVQFSAMPTPAMGSASLADRPELNRNTLHLNRGDGTFAEIAFYAGLEASGWTWSSLFLDVDLDGYEDLLMSTGHRFDTQDLDANERIAALGPMPPEKRPFKVLMYPRLALPRVAFRNLGNLRFEECGKRWGFADEGITHGMAAGDLDNDGDLDVVQNSLGEPVRVYRNETSARRVAVRLKGLAPNTRGIGARLVLREGVVPFQSQEVICGGRYLSGDEGLRVFAAGEKPMTLEVYWRSGKNSTLTNVLANRIYEIDEVHAEAPQATSPPSAPKRLFEDVSGLLNHSHHEEEFNDFARQPLLPRRLSQLGPGVTWADVDADGDEDLLIGTGKGGRIALFRNDRYGGFTRATNAVAEVIQARDTTTLLLCPGATGAQVLVGAASYESGAKTGPDVLAYQPGAASPLTVAENLASSVGPMALADIDGDGDLDLFVGGRVVPGRYPEPASSLLFRNESGRLALDEANTAALADLGLVSSAVFTDLDSDGFAELVLACEWGSLRLFKNQRGKLREATADWGLDRYVGWWHGVSAGDFNGDGRLDLVGCNWGLNTKYRATPRQPRRIYYGDFQGSGALDLVQAYYDTSTGKEMPEREFVAMAEAMPYLRGVFRTHHAYSLATLPEVLGERLEKARRVSAHTFASMLFLNTGSHFEPVELPAEAQLSPAFAAVVADFDGDTSEDLFLSQNFFATEPQTTRSDAGRGLLLLGNGKGGFRPVPGQESGIVVYGEQRGAATADYDADGRPDIAVSQNAAPTKLYRNAAGRPGLRVRLAGPPANPSGIGAVLRLESSGTPGPVREVEAGSGYWSQNGSVQVLSLSPLPSSLTVRWPGGAVTKVALPDAAKEVEISVGGELKVLR